jgi:hypothetical protein
MRLTHKITLKCCIKKKLNEHLVILTFCGLASHNILLRPFWTLYQNCQPSNHQQKLLNHLIGRKATENIRYLWLVRRPHRSRSERHGPSLGWRHNRRRDTARWAPLRRRTPAWWALRCLLPTPRGGRKTGLNGTALHESHALCWSNHQGELYTLVSMPNARLLFNTVRTQSIFIWYNRIIVSPTKLKLLIK